LGLNTAHFREWLEAIGFLAVVASLIFVRLQVRKEKEIAIVDTFSHRTDLAVELASLISTNRDIWIAGLDGRELNTADMAVFYAMANALAEYYFYRYVRASRIGQHSREGIHRKYAYLLYQCPGLRKIWSARRASILDRNRAYGQTVGHDLWGDGLDAQLSELDNRAVPIQKSTLHSVY
jgi:hypothetical protein